MIDLNDKANKLLTWMGQYEATPFWKVAVAQAYSGDNNGGKAISNTTRKLNRLDVDEATVMGIPEGPTAIATRFFKDLEDVPEAERLLPSQINQVISVLKETDKILQVGAGKGKATLILSQNVIDENSKAYFVAINDSTALAEALTVAITGLQNDINLLQTENAEQHTVIEKLKHQNRELQQEVSLYSNSTWA